MALEGKVAVIAGATGGLGRVVTRELSAKGMRLALLGSDAKKLDDLVDELHLPEGSYSTHELRAEDRDAVVRTSGVVVGRFGQVDALFNFIGGWVGGTTVVNLAPDDLTHMLNQHVWTTLHLVQAFVPFMIAKKWGRIATVSSNTSLLPQAKRGAYAAGKAAQEALVLGLARELKGTGVTANVLVVAAIDAKHERDTAPSPKNADWTTPEEISAMLTYLLSDEARVVNGQRIVMFGG